MIWNSDRDHMDKFCMVFSFPFFKVRLCNILKEFEAIEVCGGNERGFCAYDRLLVNWEINAFHIIVF